MTPTPPPFYQPTPTLIFDGLAPATPVLQLPNGDALTSNLVQGYNIVNAYNLADYFWMAIIIAILLLAIWMVIAQFRSL